VRNSTWRSSTSSRAGPPEIIGLGEGRVLVM
jgi:hypothetical protein